MSADDLIDALAADDDELRMDLQAYAERDALRAELSALKARRCDGCAHYHPAGDTPDHGWCGHQPDFVTGPDFACNAWKAKP